MTIINPWVDMIMGFALGVIIVKIIHHRPRVRVKIKRTKINK